MSTAKSCSDRCKGNELWERHTLDLGAILEAQAINAAFLSNYYDDMNELFKRYREERGLHCGYKIYHEDMPWLGSGNQSLVPNMVNNASIFPSFQSLKRPGVLPGKCRIALGNDEAQTWVQKIWDGECVHYVDPSSYEDGVCFEMHVTTTDNKHLMHCQSVPSGSQYGLTCQFHPTLEELLDFSERELLQARLLHHFFRQYAYLLPAHLVRSLCLFQGQIELALTSKKCREQLLDWNILRADLTLNLPEMAIPGEDHEEDKEELAYAIRYYLMGVGGSLAALNRWEEAARLQVELASVYKNDIISYGQAAKAFHFAGDHNAALETYVKQFGRMGEKGLIFDMNKDPLSDILGNMLFLHHAMFEAALSGHNQSNRIISENKNLELAVGFMALLRVSGFKALEQFNFEKHFGMTKATCKSALKDKFQRPKMAKQALLKLVKLGSVNEYKEYLRGVLRSGAMMPMAPAFDTGFSDDLRQFMAGGAAKSAQAIAKEKAISTRICACCFKRSSPDIAYERCQCGKVYYCNTTCQRSDWKKHKFSCSSYRKNKDQAKKNGGAGDQLECSACGKFDSKTCFKWCPCKGESYCCKECQVSDWKAHKKVCPWYLEQKKNDE